LLLVTLDLFVILSEAKDLSFLQPASRSLHPAACSLQLISFLLLLASGIRHLASALSTDRRTLCLEMSRSLSVPKSEQVSISS